ncbi:MAG: DUF1549 and DUF1553 domain-containing protein [Pirellula sp.]|nr:DUF1549 and DUF1553 domain-containing protein [Pirellula sp.]
MRPILQTPRSSVLGPRRIWACLSLMIALVLRTTGFAQQDPFPPNATQHLASGSTRSIGTALEDPNNPIARLFGSDRLDLWSLQPIQDPRIPESFIPESGTLDSIGQRQSHPIDRFLAEPLSGIQPLNSDRISKKDRLERLSLDLIGLRASYDEVQDFESDESSGSFTHQIDRLLADPRFGEHWARLWLDVVRYSDSNGFDWDEFRKQAWNYRDFVVRALNSDLAYDQFVLWQLAGDELLDGPPESLLELDRLIATGYLRLGPYDNAAKLFNEQDRARAEVLTDLTETTGSAFLGLTLSCCRCHHHKTDPLSQEDHYRFRAFFAATQFDESTKLLADNATGFFATDGKDPIEPIRVLDQGNYQKPLEQVEPGFPSVLFPNAPPIEPPGHGRTTGRRLALARWIISKENPWTARVIVNRVWQNLFGQGLVASSNDLGVTGSAPISKELLDHLSVYLVEHDWSLKVLIKYIVASDAYSAPIGPWRKLRRLSAEQLRDVVLQTTGQLQHRNGGPPVWPVLSDDVLQSNPAVLDDNETKTKGWYPSPENHQTVRSLYLVQKRTVRIPWMESFDLPENTVSCARRDTSIVPSQALALLNADWVAQASGQLAGRIEKITDAYRAILGRNPSETEHRMCEAFLGQGRSFQELILVLINSNELAFVP